MIGRLYIPLQAHGAGPARDFDHTVKTRYGEARIAVRDCRIVEYEVDRCVGTVAPLTSGLGHD